MSAPEVGYDFRCTYMTARLTLYSILGGKEKDIEGESKKEDKKFWKQERNLLEQCFLLMFPSL